MKFLVIQTAFIGDVILATAVLEKLHRFYPQGHIDFLVQKGNESLVEGHPFLRRVIVFDKKQNKIRSLLAILRDIRRENYDAVVNMHRFFSSGLITVLSGGTQKIGFDKNPMSAFFNVRVRHDISAHGTQHEVDRDLQLITLLTDPDLSARPTLYPSAQAFEKVKQVEDYVCIAPASVWFTKQWPKAKWISLIDQLADRFRVILLGSKQDRTLCEEIASAVNVKRVTNLAGELSLLESAALMKNAQMNFVNDSAPMHLASAVNAPVSAIFCSTVPAFGFGPLSDQSYVFETSESLDCRPCGLHGFRACPKGHFKCAEIDVLRVANAAGS